MGSRVVLAHGSLTMKRLEVTVAELENGWVPEWHPSDVFSGGDRPGHEHGHAQFLPRRLPECR